MYLPTLVPRLYRYKYDPNPRIQLAMSNIWSAVVPESKRAVDKYLKEILADLVENLNSRTWRNRESRFACVRVRVCVCVCVHACVRASVRELESERDAYFVPLSRCSCIALSDLLVSRQVGEVADDLPHLWELTLRVLDDVKVHTCV